MAMKNAVYADASYNGVEKRDEQENREVNWQIVARRSTYCQMNKRSLRYKAERKIEYRNTQTRAKVKHPFRVIKHQFGDGKVHFRKGKERRGTTRQLQLPLMQLVGILREQLENENLSQNYRLLIENIKNRMAKFSIVVIPTITADN